MPPVSHLALLRRKPQGLNSSQAFPQTTFTQRVPERSLAMRFLAVVLLALSLLLPGAFGSQTESASAQSRSDLLASVLAPDFHSMTPEGRTFDRSQALEEARQRATMHFPYRVEHADVQIFQFGGTAVVAYTKEYVGTEGEVKGKVRKQGFVDVFTKDSSGWKLNFTKAEAGAASPEQ
jgi:hypothetical protein